MPPSESESYPISDAVSRFIHDLEGIKGAEESACPLLGDVFSNAVRELAKITKGLEGEFDGEGGVTFYVPLAAAKSVRAAYRKFSLARSAHSQTPRALFVAMVSAFDAYLGRLLRSVFILKPELIHASQRSLSFTELVQFGSIEAAMEYIIAEEVEGFLRESHVEHFNWLEKRLGMTLREGLPSWATFVEVTQRRNLYVHCDGVVSQQYIDVCRNNGVTLDEIEVGQCLLIDSEYFGRAFSCLYEIGVKLAHVIWRKLARNQLEAADKALNEVCYELLQNERYELAHNLLTFAAHTLKRHGSVFYRRMFVINLAIASKFGGLGDVAQCLQLEDWSDCAVHFVLAKAVLEEDFDAAGALMKRIGPESEMLHRVAYDSWPLFKEFRETDQFQDAYKDLFGEECVVEQSAADVTMLPADDCGESEGEAVD